jgi:hypothetical protein
MNIKPISAPLPVTPGESPAQQSAKARAIAAFQQPPAQVVQNQSQVSAEEMGAIRPPTRQVSEDVGQLQANEAAPEETVAEEVPAAEEPKPDKALEAQYNQLARRERALRAKAQQQEAAIKAREAALAAKESELTAKGNSYNTGYVSKDALKANPLGVLAEAGLSYDEVVQAALNQQPIDPRMEATISKLEAKIKQLEEANESTSKSMTAQQQAAYDAAVNQISLDVKSLVKSDPSFETIRATRSENDVVDLIKQTYEKDGQLLSVEEASQMVEDYLIEEAMKLTKIGKIKSRLSAPAQAAKPQAQEQTRQSNPPKQTQPGIRTLTNSTGTTRQLSAKERAILAFKGELK